jgi:hypothetical protein
MPELPGLPLLARLGDRLLELRIELESQTAFRARQRESNSSVQIPRPRL